LEILCRRQKQWHFVEPVHALVLDFIFIMKTCASRTVYVVQVKLISFPLGFWYAQCFLEEQEGQGLMLNLISFLGKREHLVANLVPVFRAPLPVFKCFRLG
jgi:hypothetical protein